jgi:Questin oxidase-like
MRVPCYSTLDDALDTIAPYGIELKNGNSNHAPMVAEALCAMGRPEEVPPWLERYRARMSLRPTTGDRITREDWRGALGRREHFADWAMLFTEELDAAPWRAVLDLWVGRLAPGFSAAATHGPIRVGHAARALGESETPARRRELAEALAGWAATYRELSAPSGADKGLMPPRRAIAEVPVVPPDKRRSGNIVAALAALDDFPRFAPTIGLIDTTGDIDSLVAGLADTFARVFLANVHNIPTAIAFIHGVTSVAALGNMGPHLEATTMRNAARYSWQAGCALYACYGDVQAIAEQTRACEDDGNTLAERAIQNGDEHVIKFTEACLARNAIEPSPVYAAAVAHLHGVLVRR